ncbi:hypothetical protein [Pontimicrobium sp. IMCC45349]|uniref:hypothetical protein n=1 Tax=Pontimicrobium sp. IMCC45349 TaxID=3391574 RepID=UPI0039A00B91
MDNYLLEFEIIDPLKLVDVISLINRTAGIPLKNINLNNLVFHNNQPIFPGNGVYLFRKGRQVVYVGKNDSLSFVERIPKHLDLRQGAWFNKMLQHTNANVLKYEWNDESCIKANKYAIDNYNLVLVNFKYEIDERKYHINRLERTLRASLEPFNKFKKFKIFDLEKRVTEY